MRFFLSRTHRLINMSTSGSSAFTGDTPVLNMGIFQKLLELGLCMPMTNLRAAPVFRSVLSATTAAMTAPTNPSPMTTTISLPRARSLSTRPFRRSNSLP